MPIPQAPILSNAASEAIEAARHPRTGLPYPAFDDSNVSDPRWTAKMTTLLMWIQTLLANVSCGAVDQITTGFINTRSVDVYPVEYMIGSTLKSYAGGTFSVPAAGTHYLYLDADEVIKSHAVAWPADVFKLAVVVTDATKVTAIKDARQMNYGIALNAWWNVAAGAAANLAGFDLLNAGRVVYAAPATLTIASGLITPTLSAHKVETEGAVSADDLNSIAAHATLWPRTLILSQATSGHIVTLVQGGNIDNIPTGGIPLIPGAHVLLYQYSATRWAVIADQYPVIEQLNADLYANAKNIEAVGALSYAADAQAVTSGAIDLDDATLVMVGSEGGAPTDDLVSLAATDQSPRILVGFDPDEVVTVKHGVGTGLIRLKGGKDFVLDGPQKVLIVKKCDDEQFVELARFPADLSEMVGTSQCIPQEWSVFVSGALSAAVHKHTIKPAFAGTITFADGHVETAPSGGPCRVKVLHNGANIFANDAEGIQIADGATDDASAVKNHAYAAGDEIQIEITATNSAADLTVTIHALTAAQAMPVP